MLEAAASPAYKDLLETLGKLAEWTEQAGKSGLPSGPPPDDLVRAFNKALEAVPVEGVQAASSAHGTLPAAVGRPVAGPAESVVGVDVVAEAMPSDGRVATDLSQPESKPVRPADDAVAAEDRLFEGQRRAVGPMTDAQEVNVERGLDALHHAADAHRADFFDSARKLTALLSRPAMEISPMDLLQAQRLVGVLKVHAESGKKFSEGVSDTLEQLLEQQG